MNNSITTTILFVIKANNDGTFCVVDRHDNVYSRHNTLREAESSVVSETS